MQISPPEISLSCSVARTTVFDRTVWFFWYKVCWQHYSNRTCESPPFIRCSFQRHLSSSVTGGHFATFNTILFTKGCFFGWKSTKVAFVFGRGSAGGATTFPHELLVHWGGKYLHHIPLSPYFPSTHSASRCPVRYYDHVATPVSCLWRQQHVSNFVISKGRNVSAPRH